MAGTLSAPPGASAGPLPSRWLAEIRSVAHCAPDGRASTLTLAIEYHPAQPMRPREVAYLAGHRSGAQLERDLRDLCAVLSALLRLGAEPAKIARALAEESGVGEEGGAGSSLTHLHTTDAVGGRSHHQGPSSSATCCGPASRGEAHGPRAGG